MVAPNEKLAQSLTVLEKYQNEGQHVYRSAEFSRTDRERLLRHGWLQPVMHGWLMASDPGVGEHDSTLWYAGFWEFCARYCTHWFGDRWHLSPDLSLNLHAENTVVPQQVVVHAPGAGNNRIDLPFNMSLFALRSQRTPAPEVLCVKDGVRVFTVEAALVRVPARFFRDHAVESRTALAGMRQITELVRRLLAGSHSKVAGRLAGAFRHIGRELFADEIVRAMRDTEHVVRESNPFVSDEGQQVIARGGAGRYTATPISHRLQTLWELAREPILAAFPAAPGLPADANAKARYLAQAHALYVTDAYHSLSIEGYRVTPELIEKVRSGDWDPAHVTEDRQQKNVLAARGYWQAFQAVHLSINDILSGANPGERFRTDHGRWYFELFQPFVAAGLYGVTGLAGYRNQAVYLRGSRYVPPRHEVIPDAMETLFDLLEQEPSPAVRAAAGHWLFGYVHPLHDGNGRVARFLMNAMLASGGYPWTVIRMEDRATYLASLEAASVNQDFGPFAEFIAGNVRANMPATTLQPPDDADETPNPKS